MTPYTETRASSDDVERRLRESLNRSAAQRLHHMHKGFQQARERLGVDESFAAMGDAARAEMVERGYGA